MDLPATLRRNGAVPALAAMLLATPAAEGAIGRTPGFASVSDDGEAVYSIGLDLPPGTNGLTPVLSLDYRHRARGGLLGAGWSIGGLSQITRCAKTFAQDGVAAPASGSPDTRFCLDGQRLVLASGIIYNQPNAEYRTEIESFARIRAVAGAINNGPAYFIVEGLDGRIYEYGATADSSIDGRSTAPAGGARTWALSRIRDRSGNVIDYRYTEESGSTAYRIASIRYNANPSNGIVASHEVEFTYEARPSTEVDTGYQAGMPVRVVMRLSRIDVLYGGQVLRRYALAYEPALSSGGRSRLASVKECGAGGSDCFAPTVFEWQDGTAGMSPMSAFTANVPMISSTPLALAWNLADINGDGRHDYVFAGGAQMSSATIHFRLSLADGSLAPTVNTGIPCPGGIGRPFDADGDGRTDFLLSLNGRWAIARGTASGLGVPVDTGIAVPAGRRDYRGADINGDGLGDIVWSDVPAHDAVYVRAQLAKPAGGYGAPVTLYSQWETHGYVEPEGGDFLGVPGRRVDLDGDGAEELLLNENYTVARISMSAHATDRPDTIFRGGVPLDFNDDDCTDLAYKHMTSGTLRVRLSACTIHAPAWELLGPAWAGTVESQALDWNGDGRDDVLLRGTTNWLVALSLGDSVAPFADTGVPHEGGFAITGRDLDGDGLGDIVARNSTQFRARFRSGPVPDLLASATDGFGVGAKFQYRPLTDSGIHVAGAPAGWPDPSLQTNDLVVSELRQTDGTGKSYWSTAEFRYEGLRGNVQGRGSLGFRRVFRSEAAGDPPLTSVLTRRQDFPFTGLPEKVILQRQDGKAIASTGYLWSKLEIGAWPQKRQYPFPSVVSTRQFGVGGSYDGAEITRTDRTIAAVDPTSGVVTDETTTTTETAGGANPGSSATARIQQTVFNDVASWCLGRPQETEVTASHTLAGGAAVVRTADQAWDGMKCRPSRTRLFPGDSQWQVTHDLAYDAFGNLASEKVTGAGMAARTVATQWGTRGQLPVQVTNPLAQSTRYGWDEARGLPLSFTDPNGLTVTWVYDAFGRPVRESQPDGTATRWSRDACKGQCDARAKYRLRQDDLDNLGAVKASAWLDVDQHDRGVRLQSMQPGGAYAVSTTDFDTKGRITRRYLPHWTGGHPPGSQSFGYDVIGRLISDQLAATGAPASRSVEISYDGLAVTQKDSLGRSTTGTRSAWGRLGEVRDATGERTRYEYDAFGGLLRVRDALGNSVSSITYNPRGFKLAVTDVDRGTWSWTRNALGEVTALRDGKGKVAQFSYDPLGRVTQRTDADGTSTWTWGASAASRNVGRVAALSTPGYSEAFTYDGVGRPATHTITSDAPYRFDFGYNALGLIETLTYPSAGAGDRFRISHFYDAGRVTQVQSANADAGAIWRQIAQDASGNPLDETLGAAVRVVSGFSPITGDLEYRQAGTGGSAVQDLAYEWDAAGNLSARRDLNQNLREEFRYDALDRLVESRRNGAVNLELDYDAIGNIRRKSDVCSGTAPCYSYHATRKHAVVAVGGRSYVYDANGNMTKRKGATIAWSADNRPLSIVGSGGSRSEFSYGPEGNRWRQVASHGTATETTIYAGGLFEKVTGGGKTTWRHYVPSPGGTIVHIRHGDGGAAETRILTLDHLGSTDRIVDSEGDAIVSESFAAFGGRRRSTWTGIPTSADLAKIAASTRDGFTGHEMLDNLGLVHMNGRVYDPEIGRFISADPYVTLPYDGQGLNRYAYALNNPLAFTDPSGFDPVPCLATQSGNCVQITVVAASWPNYLRSTGGAHASEVASALERDPCGQNGNAGACYLPSFVYSTPSSIVLTVGKQPDATLSTGGRLDAAEGFAARVANLAISSSPIALLFGADPDFQYFREPGSDAGRLGARFGNVGYLIGGAAGMIRKGGYGFVTGGPTEIARSFQGSTKYPNIDRFKNITLKKGTLLYAGYPGQGMFYTTASAMRRTGASASTLWRGLQVAAHHSHPPRTRMAAFEVVEDTPAAFGLALANIDNGIGGLPQIVVPSYMTSLRFVTDFPLGL